MKRWGTRNEMHIKSLGIKEKEHVMMTKKKEKLTRGRRRKKKTQTPSQTSSKSFLHVTSQGIKYS